MEITLTKRISTILMVLFLFSGELLALPLSRTCYTAPVETVDFYVGEELVSGNGARRRELFSFNTGLTGATTVGLSWSMLHSNLSGGESEPGDLVVELWHYTGRYIDDTLDTGICVSARIPSGPDPCEDKEWRYLSVGRNELKITPVCSFRLTEHELLNLNLNYIFREGADGKFYSGFKWDLKDADTYKSLFGLNPFYGETFLSGSMLSDDYISVSASLVETGFYPVIMYCELYHAFTDFQNDSEVEVPVIEGEGGGITLFSAGFKYFVRESVYFNVYSIVNPCCGYGGYRWSTGVGINVFF